MACDGEMVNEIYLRQKRRNIFACHPTSASPSSRSSSSFLFVISGMTSSRIFNSLLVKNKSSAFLIPIITTNINGKRIDVEEKDLTTHRQTRHVN